jgi:hypothetical protein
VFVEMEKTTGITLACAIPSFHSVTKKGHDSAVWDRGQRSVGEDCEGQQGSEECRGETELRNGHGSRLLNVAKATNNTAMPHAWALRICTLYYDGTSARWVGCFSTSLVEPCNILLIHMNPKLIGVGLAFVVGMGHSQTLQTARSKFEVVSIKPLKAEAQNSRPRFDCSTGGFVSSGVPVKYLIQWAFDIRTEFSVPDWSGEGGEKYNIEGKADGSLSRADCKLMAQGLSSRFPGSDVPW